MIWVLAAAILALGLWHAAIYVRGEKRAGAERAEASDMAAGAADIEALLAMDGVQASELTDDTDGLPEELAGDWEEPPLQDICTPGIDALETRVQALNGVDAVWIAGLGLAAAFWRLLAALVFGWNAEVCFQTLASLMMDTLVGSLVGIGACYALIRRCGGGRAVCVLGGIILALNLSWSTMAGAWALLSLVFCLRSMDGWRTRGGNLVAASAFIAFAVYLDAASAVFAAGLWMIVVAEAVAKLVQKKRGAKGAMVRAALLFPVAAVGFYAVMLLPGALVGGATAQTLGVWMLVRTLMVFSAAKPELRQLLASPDTIVCMGYGALCAALALWAFFRESRREAAIVCGVMCASALALGLMGFMLAPAASVIAAGYVWTRFSAREDQTQVWLAGGILIAVELIMNVLRVAH